MTIVTNACTNVSVETSATFTLTPTATRMPTPPPLVLPSVHMLAGTAHPLHTSISVGYFNREGPLLAASGEDTAYLCQDLAK